jgi:hypothetical protein
MTRTANARIAGFTFLFYIAIGLAGMALDRRATMGEGAADRLANLAAQASVFRTSLVLTVFMGLCALVLAVTLHALTRGEDAEIARLAMCCRLGEGLVGMAGIPPALGLLRLATSPAESGHSDLSGANALGGSLLEVGGGNALVCSILFAFGSTLFCWLFLRARTIPAPLAWLGVGASLLLVVVLPAQLGGVVSGPATGYAWMPMLLFELGFALWLLVKGGDARVATAGPGGATSRR